MALNYHGLDGAIGPPKTADYSTKQPPAGTKNYTKTFSRLSISGGIIKNARSYAGKVELQPLIFGDVQSQDSAIAGVITRTAFRTISGAVQSQATSVSGTVDLIGKVVSGNANAQSSATSGTVTAYPLTGWKLTDFDVAHAGLDPDSPFTDPAYSTIEALDKCHYEASTSPDAHVPTMDGNGRFTVVPPGVVQANTFDVQIYDLSDGTFGATATITIYPEDADVTLAGSVQSDNSTVTGALIEFTVHDVSGSVQSVEPIMFGLVTSSPTGNLEIITGNVQADAPVLSGAIEVISTLSGAIQADSAIVAGSIKKTTVFSGGVQAQPPVLSGDISPPTEDPSTTGPRGIKQKFINRGIKWKSRQRKMN